MYIYIYIQIGYAVFYLLVVLSMRFNGQIGYVYLRDTIVIFWAPCSQSD